MIATFHYLLIVSFVICTLWSSSAQTDTPSTAPSSAPITPSLLPTFGPTVKPTVAPSTRTPTVSFRPTSPTFVPTNIPSYSIKPTSPTVKPSAKPTSRPSSASPTVNNNPQINGVIFTAVLVPVISLLCLIGIIRAIWIIFGKASIKGTAAEQANLVPSGDAADNNL